MAQSGNDKEKAALGAPERAQLLKAFEERVKLGAAGKTLTAADMRLFNEKACGKLSKDCMPEISNLVDSSVFSAMKTKGKKTMDLTENSCEEFVHRSAHEFVKMKTKNNSIDYYDSKVAAKKHALVKKIISSGPNITATATSKTGNVSGLTDTSKYTGSHANRFDDSGKGKGKAGREDLHANTGYVGAYKGKDTYDKKH